MSDEVQPTRERLEDLFQQVARNARVRSGDGGYSYAIYELVDAALTAAFNEPQGG